MPDMLQTPKTEKSPEKEQRRSEQNRVAARKSREKRHEKLIQLQQRDESHQAETEDLRKENASLQIGNERLRSENERLELEIAMLQRHAESGHSDNMANTPDTTQQDRPTFNRDIPAGTWDRLQSMAPGPSLDTVTEPHLPGPFTAAETSSDTAELFYGMSWRSHTESFLMTSGDGIPRCLAMTPEPPIMYRQHDHWLEDW